MSEACLMLDVANAAYDVQLTAAGLAGLANRFGPRVMLDWGRYDAVDQRTTNEVFIPEDIWLAKFQQFIGFQDRENRAYYESAFDLQFEDIDSIFQLIEQFKPCLKGVVIWDPALLDTVNLAIMLAGQENLLVLSPEQAAQGVGGDLRVKHDLRGSFTDRLSLYRWALKHLQPCCRPGEVACVEPGWRRPEFVDYLVQNRIFTYSLGTGPDRPLGKAGQTLLLLLTAGPIGLRNLIYTLHLEAPVRGLGLFLLGLGNPEARLATRIQRQTCARPVPTVYGWHTQREDEFAFMLHLSSNGMRLIPSHMASNFSFHSAVPYEDGFSQPHKSQDDVSLEWDKTYLTFTLSDGDQLMAMNIRELGNWDRPERGKVPFNWEVQPCLVEMAPAIYARYYQTLTDQDYLIAGPSGAGYVIPPVMRRFKRYLRETDRVCRKASIRVLTSYIGDPPRRIVRETAKGTPDCIGYWAGYTHFGRHPQGLVGGKPFVANQWPPLDKIHEDAEDVLADVREMIGAGEESPRFLAVHLFAYRTTITDIYEFVQTLDPAKVKVVKADEFLLAAQAYYAHKEKEG
ncbi:hypothetical protein KQH62_03135 [bacterium]|nr:hypothetical protein [bacterium]